MNAIGLACTLRSICAEFDFAEELMSIKLFFHDDIGHDLAKRFSRINVSSLGAFSHSSQGLLRHKVEIACISIVLLLCPRDHIMPDVEHGKFLKIGRFDVSVSDVEAKKTQRTRADHSADHLGMLHLCKVIIECLVLYSFG